MDAVDGGVVRYGDSLPTTTPLTITSMLLALCLPNPKALFISFCDERAAWGSTTPIKMFLSVRKFDPTLNVDP